MRVEPNATWKFVSDSKTDGIGFKSCYPHKKLVMFIFTLILFIISLLLIKVEGIEEYGVAGVLVSIVAFIILFIFYICAK